jgi:hypothetical protein
MPFIRVGLVEFPPESLDARLHALGVRSLLEQEGITYTVLDSARPAEALGAVDVLVLVDYMQMGPRETAQWLPVLERLPALWTGLLHPQAPDELLQALGLPAGADRPQNDMAGMLRVFYARYHKVTERLSDSAERSVRLKRIPTLLVTASLPEGTEEAVTIELADGTRLGSGVVVREQPQRRVTLCFPAGLVFTTRTGRHLDPRGDLDEFDYPSSTAVDTVRVLLREGVRWLAPQDALPRVYYWPLWGADGALGNAEAIPRGAYMLSHNLCAEAGAGIEFILDTCRTHGLRTTFFLPSPDLLTPEQAGEHVVALQSSDTASPEELLWQKRALEERQGRPISGWRRMGPSQPTSYPDIWRRLVRAGFAWCSSFPVQSQCGLAPSEGTATGCRLPYWVVDVETAERLPLVELPSLDTQDIERLTNIRYGARLSQWQFEAHARSRLDLVQKNNVAGGYHLHGWTAGGATEEGRFYGAPGCRELLRRVIDWAKEREVAIVTHQQVYDWWVCRARCRLNVQRHLVEFAAPESEYRAVLEVMQPAAQEEALALEIEGAAGEPAVWGNRTERRYLIPAAPGEEPLRVRVV